MTHMIHMPNSVLCALFVAPMLGASMLQHILSGCPVLFRAQIQHGQFPSKLLPRRHQSVAPLSILPRTASLRFDGALNVDITEFPGCVQHVLLLAIFIPLVMNRSNVFWSLRDHNRLNRNFFAHGKTCELITTKSQSNLFGPFCLFNFMRPLQTL